MNKIYTLSLSGLMLITAPSFAQYTAIRAGDWHNTGAPSNTIWAGAEPPASCGAGCTITLAVVGGGTINLNKHVVFSAGAQMTIGDGTNANATVLEIANSSATDTGHANSITMINDNTGTVINVTAASSLVVAPNSGNQGDFDGVFTAYVTPGTPPSESFFKSVGYAPNGIVNNTIVSGQTPSLQELTGGQTLNSAGTLPILLSAFGATLGEGGVDLDWTTSLEINSDHFVVERSSNAGAGWDVVGTISAHGNSVATLHYSFTDNKPVQGTSEYRLQMVDKDGKYAFSEVKTIRTGMITGVSVYPNPARDFVNVTLGSASGFTLIRLYNQGGQLLQEKSTNNPGGSVIPLSVSGYPEGNYIVVVTGADGTRQANKVVITK
ncbi:MAG TPA: T9SS type A sorting domain-containing protein [Puia sp.]|jgi:hypothetical protein|nr:T9SS type A sorting domain-containing protein [Puia sp.]